MSTVLKNFELDFATLPDFRWMENGQSVLTGKLAALYNRLDEMFFEWAEDWAADSYIFPTFISASDLAKVQYFHSFPHLVTFPAALENDEENIKAFIEGLESNSEESTHDNCSCSAPYTVKPTKLAPITDVLTPAACYHFYPQFSGQSVPKARYVTTKATCYRREDHYKPLQRQWAFSMREIVCIGSEEEVQSFLATMQSRLADFFSKIQLEIKFENATDPFFNPAKNPKYLWQKVQPVKTEMVFQDRLAIGSFNFHRDHFGRAFEIESGGKPAFSGCAAFGIERWIYAYLCRFGFGEEKFTFE